VARLHFQIVDNSPKKRTMKRRIFIKNSFALAAISALGVSSLFAKKQNNAEVSDEFTLPKLPYAYDALEPIIDKATMEIHHGKHHQAYINNLNKALVGVEKTWTNVDDICRNKKLMKIDALRNNAGGHYNHSLFWELMKPAPASAPTGNLATAIEKNFGSLDKLKTAFNDAALKRFGSGWVWLVKDAKGNLVITTTANQDNPLMHTAAVKGQPILALDVWEHAYYLKYQNKRKDYVEAWWTLVNWEKANALFA
jgi:Fe-Mn family superoxide dismutase